MTLRGVHPTASSQGFVLPVVAIAIAVFALSVLTLVSTIDGAATRVARLQDDAAFERRAITAQSRIAFLMATEPLRAGALAVGADRAAPIETPLDPRDRALHLDGRAYATVVEGRTMVVNVQDTAGLLNLNAADHTRLARLIAGVTGDSSAAMRAAASVADYADPDDVRRQGGAEGNDYARRGLPRPRGAPLEDVREVNDVLDWDTLVPAMASRTLFTLTRAAPVDAGLNVNTAPVPVIAAALGVDEGRARQIVQRREAQPVRNADDLAAIAGGGLQSEGLSFAAAPDRMMRVTVRDANPGRAPRRMTTSLVLAENVETPPIGVGPRDISPDPEQRSSDERPEPLPAGGRLPPR